MATATFYPAVSADDGNIGEDGLIAEFSNSNDYRRIGYYSGYAYNYHHAYRFSNVTIPQGATITECYIKLTAGDQTSGTETNLVCHFKDLDNGTQPTGENLSWWNSGLTTGTDWLNVPATTAWSQYDTPSLVSELQAIVNRSGWTSGNNVTAVIRNKTAGTGGHRSFCFIDRNSGANKPELHVTWSTAIPLSVDESIGLIDNPTIPYYESSVEEFLDLLDELRYFSEGVEDTLDFGELFLSVYADVLEDGFDVDDSSIQGLFYSYLVAEGIELTSDELLTWYKSILDSLFIYDTPLPSWAKTIIESLILTDSSKPLLGVPVSDWLWLIDSQVNNWKGTQVVPAEKLSLYDLPSGTRIVNRSLAETINLADSITLQFLVRLLEYMRFTDLVTAIGTFNHSAADTIRLTDDAARGFDKLIAETLTSVDTNAILTTFLPSLAESLGIADSSSNGLTASKIITDSLSLTDVSGSGLHAFTIIQDAIALNVSVEIDGELYECYVLNTPKFMPSVYSGFDFNSYCSFEGKAYGANSTGIYELTGETDAGQAINTGVVLSQTTFGIPDSKKLRRAWLGISGTTPTLVLEVEDGTRRAYTIDDYGEVGSDREISGKKWKLTVANFGELDFIKILPVALAR